MIPAHVTVWLYKLETERFSGNGIRGVRLFIGVEDIHLPTAENRMSEAGPATRQQWQEYRAKFVRSA
jgi:hypothetical protein